MTPRRVTPTSKPSPRLTPEPLPKPKPTNKQTPPGFNAVISKVNSADVQYTYRAGCPVGPSQLRKITMTFRAYDGSVRRGELIVAASHVQAYTETFRAAFNAGFRINRMDNPNVWHGDDEAMMAADNTSAFNCRAVTGNASRVSPHSYGTAFDVNTRRNPYLAVNDVWYPSNSAIWIDRSKRDAGMVSSSSTITRQVIERGGIWGGTWVGPDYQHYEFR